LTVDGRPAMLAGEEDPAMPRPKQPVTTPRPVAAYVRVSGRDQKTDSQREEIRRWLEGSGIAPDMVEWYVDIESGRKMSQPEFDRLRADFFAGTARTVVVFKVDRIARRLREGRETTKARRRCSRQTWRRSAGSGAHSILEGHGPH
jgi:predicted site-specific integrase-resolvase